MWSDVWQAMYGVVCLSILLEGGVTVTSLNGVRMA